MVFRAPVKGVLECFAILVPIPLVAFRMINPYAERIPGFIGCLMCLFLNGSG